MIKLLLLTLLFLSSLYANKVIYLSYEELPQRVIKGEIFPFTLKTLSTVKQFQEVHYDFSNYKGIKLLTTDPQHVQNGKYYYDTFYALSTEKLAKLPDINATLIGTDEYNSTTVIGKDLNIITLNPRQNFSNIIANKFSLIKYKTTSYDSTHNILVIMAEAENSDIKAMHFLNVKKQGIESVTDSYKNSKITYFLVIDKQIENFSFSYFNLLKNHFSLITIPIIVDDDSVTTQSDLKPKDQSKERLKMSIAAAVAFVALILILWRRKYIYLVFLVIPLAYIIYLAIPDKEICIKKGTQIRLLPVHNGTIFETTTSQSKLLKEGGSEDFVKVELHNHKIGWVKNEDICSN